MNPMFIQIIDSTHHKVGRKASYNDYRDTAFELFPDEMNALHHSFSRQGFIKWLKDGMRQMANVDESDPLAPEVQLDLLPGVLAAPAYLNIGSFEEPHLIPVGASVIDDWNTAIEKRKRVSTRIMKRVEDMQLKTDWFAAHAPTPTATLAETIAHSIAGIPA